jgi:uncharacterized protein YjbI with pentapeptide repeats
MGDGTKENPYTREDVLRLIKQNGNTAEGLDLSRKVFEEGINLSGLNRLDLNFFGIILNNAQLFRANFKGSNLDLADMKGANLQYANFNPSGKRPTSLQGIDLRGAYLENAEFKEADLSSAQFQGGQRPLFPAFLNNTDFRGANLYLANFTGCHFYGTKLEGAFIRGADITEAYLGDADWGNYKIGEEIGKGAKRDLYAAEHRYRQLKMWYNQSGYYDITAKFYYREMEARRKALKWRSKDLHHRLYTEFMRALFGYGEKWGRVVYWMAAFLILFAAAYYFWGKLEPLDSLYYSAVSFTALGYGKWALEPIGWVKGLGALEAFVGVFMMALLLVTFVRKWTR